jgi:ataxia telangiectasia mutated family protein
MELLIRSYIELAKAPAPADPNATTMPFPASIRRERQNLDAIPLMTEKIPIDPECQYIAGNFPTFVEFKNTIRFVGGINRPKLCVAVDSDGREHRHLVKGGGDDLRQDAVMQQFFGVINSFLDDKQKTRKRGLRMRTYNVVPLSPYEGLVQFVENTIPLTDYLTGGGGGGGGALRRYGKQEQIQLHHSSAWHKIQDKEKKKGNQGRLGEEFTKFIAKVPKVLHHFFLERYPHPGAWFERRLAYVRSTAVSSMAGYIIGLGDRHGSNILVDERSAEVIHIDLGIAFEQGKFLLVPEMVPFRLTGNVVDGMGPVGVEGPMRRCCEEALTVMRAARESLLTVIEVFIHDPLINWKMTAEQAQRRQRKSDGDGDGEEDEDENDDDDEEESMGNIDAERTLVRVRHKLEGVVEGEGEARGVEGQVQELLHQAMEAERLGKMYIGWAAYL